MVAMHTSTPVRRAEDVDIVAAADLRVRDDDLHRVGVGRVGDGV